jgi:hypothetical protein
LGASSENRLKHENKLKGAIKKAFLEETGSGTGIYN